jgi:hypothetical protein
MVIPEVTLFRYVSLKEITWQSHAFSGVGGRLWNCFDITLFIFSQTPTPRFAVRHD